MEEQIAAAIKLAERYAGIDGAHHKQWVIDQMVRALLGENYGEWLAEYNHESRMHDYDAWDQGIAP